MRPKTRKPNNVFAFALVGAGAALLVVGVALFSPRIAVLVLASLLIAVGVLAFELPGVAK